MVLAGIAFIALLFVALFGERVAPHEPIYFVLEHGRDPRPYDPGIVFPFGSDVLGRDLLSLILAGARVTLAIVLLAGMARVLAGVLVAAVASWWRPTRLLTETVAELVSAVPATLAALILVKVFVHADTSVLVFIGAILLMGWAGPYRVVRAELDRLARASFTEGARVLGLGRWRIFWRHQLPHLVPLIAVNLMQQVVASLVLVAELGVLGAFVGTTRSISVEESLTVVRTGPVNVAQIADPPEWGGLLASSRSVEALWTTRWLILLPGIAFAVTAVAVAVIGHALARRYARRDLFEDARGRGFVGVLVMTLVLFVASALVPERYAAAREWSDAARAEVGKTAETVTAFERAGLRPLAPDFTVKREIARIVPSNAATLSVGATKIAEQWPRRPADPAGRDPLHVRSLVTSGTGGGSVTAPLVFAARGISPSAIPPAQLPFGVDPRFDLGRRIVSYADDYASVDVRGKVVMLVRFLGISLYPRGSTRQGFAGGPSVGSSIADVIKRGAAAVIFVDPALAYYTDVPLPYTIGLGRVGGGPNPYLGLERDDPATDVSGVPVIVLDPSAAAALAAPLGIELSPFLDYDEPDATYERSVARDLGVTARVEVPLRRETASIASYVGEIPAAAGASSVLLWSRRTSEAQADVLSAIAMSLGRRSVPFTFVDFDPALDPVGNAKVVTDVLKERPISLVIVLDRLEGKALQFKTVHGDLIPAFDLYAEKAGTRYRRTVQTAQLGEWIGIAPIPEIRTMLVQGDGGSGDVRGDAAALIGYLAGRLALGAEELR